MPRTCSSSDRERRVGGRVTPEPPEQGADRGQDLAEVVVELACERALHVLLDPQHPLRQRPQLGVERLDGQEGPPVRGHDPRAQPRSDDQDHPHQHQDLAPDAIVDGAIGARRLLLDLIVGDQELRHQPVDRAMLRDERALDQAARRGFVGSAEREHPGDVAPVGVDTLDQARLLCRIAGRRRELLLEPGRFREVLAHPIEGRLPARQWIGLGAIDHVAHQRRERRQVVLNPEELQRVLAIALADGRLLVPQAPDLAVGVGADPRDRAHPDRHADRERAPGGPGGGTAHLLNSIHINAHRPTLPKLPSESPRTRVEKPEQPGPMCCLVFHCPGNLGDFPWQLESCEVAPFDRTITFSPAVRC